MSHGNNNPGFTMHDVDLDSKSNTGSYRHGMRANAYENPCLVSCKDCGNSEFWLAIEDNVMTVKCNICGESVKYELE